MQNTENRNIYTEKQENSLEALLTNGLRDLYSEYHYKAHKLNNIRCVKGHTVCRLHYYNMHVHLCTLYT
jgi:hypothetical protein